jgi:hypothetical protein
MHFCLRHIVWSFALAALCAPQLPAEYDPGQRAKAIGPFLDGQMVLLAHADLTRIEPEQVANQLAELLPENKQESERVRGGLRLVHSTLVNAGAKELFVIVSLADLPGDAPIFVFPGGDAIKTDALKDLPLGPGQAVESLHGSVVIARPRALERLKKLQVVEHPELTEALRAAGDSALQIALALTDNDRRVIEELQPTLPEQVGGGPGTIVTQGFRWLGAGIDPPPQLAVRVTIQSRDPAAAATLRNKLTELVALAARLAGAEHQDEVAKALGALVPEVQGDRLVLQPAHADVVVRSLLTAIRPAQEQARQRAQRAQAMNNLKQLGLALHMFYDAQKRFPAVGTFDAAGKPLLSWRVHVLPHLDQQALYRQFRLNEPWDSEHNRKLIAQMPAVFRSPSSRLNPMEGLTVYREVTGEHTMFPEKDGIEFKHITDGTSNTIMLVEVDDQHGVVWTKPEGLPFNAETPAQGLGKQQDGGFLALFGDGSVRFIVLPKDAETLRRLLIIDDGKPVPEL